MITQGHFVTQTRGPEQPDKRNNQGGTQVDVFLKVTSASADQRTCVVVVVVVVVWHWYPVSPCPAV